MYKEGFPGDASDKEAACQYKQYKRHAFDPFWMGRSLE